MKTLSLFVMLAFLGQAHAEEDVMVKCSGAGYEFDMYDNGFTFGTTAKLLNPAGAPAKMSCSIYTGEPNASWSCSQDTMAKTRFELVMYGAEWSNNISAKLFHGPRLVAEMTCKKQ